MKPYWQQSVNIHNCAAAKNLMHLLMNEDQQVRPDALIVMDDALIADAVEGLQAAGVSIPDDLFVIAHANFPNPVRCSVPLQYLGYELSGLLETCMAMAGALETQCDA